MIALNPIEDAFKLRNDGSVLLLELGNPLTELRAICRDLVLPFEPSFIEKFHTFDRVTGDLTRKRERTISAPKKKVLPPGLIDEFRSSPSFAYILRATGYADLC